MCAQTAPRGSCLLLRTSLGPVFGLDLNAAGGGDDGASPTHFQYLRQSPCHFQMALVLRAGAARTLPAASCGHRDIYGMGYPLPKVEQGRAAPGGCSLWNLEASLAWPSRGFKGAVQGRGREAGAPGVRKAGCPSNAWGFCPGVGERSRAGSTFSSPFLTPIGIGTYSSANNTFARSRPQF